MPLITSNSGAFSENIRTISTTASLTTVDDVVLCNAGGGAFTVTFPAASTSTNKVITIKKTDGTFNAITLTGTGMTTNYLMTSAETVTWVSDGSVWNQLQRQTNNAWTAYTPTVTGTTAALQGFYWRRVGNCIEISGTFGTSSATGSAVSITIPNSGTWTIDSGQVATTNSTQRVGVYTNLGVAPGATQAMFLDLGTSTSIIYFAETVSSSLFTKGAGTSITTNGARINVACYSIPITNFSS